MRRCPALNGRPQAYSSEASGHKLKGKAKPCLRCSIPLQRRLHHRGDAVHRRWRGRYRKPRPADRLLRRPGITGVTVLGIMGEAPKLTHEESVALTRQVVRRVNGLPVVVGVSSPGFASMGALAKDVMDAGAGGVMIAPPGRSRPTTRSSRICQRRGGDRPRRAVRAPGLSLCVGRLHGAVGDQAHRARTIRRARW